LQGLLLLLRSQVPMPLQPSAKVCLLIVFKSWPGTRLRRPRKTRGQWEHQQQHREHTSSQLPTMGSTFVLVVDCHAGALRSGYVDRRIRAPRFPVFLCHLV
jgi:hypothetical protein